MRSYTKGTHMGPEGFFFATKKAKKVHYRICLGCSVNSENVDV